MSTVFNDTPPRDHNGWWVQFPEAQKNELLAEGEEYRITLYCTHGVANRTQSKIYERRVPDLPVGSVVFARGVAWVRLSAESVWCWYDVEAERVSEQSGQSERSVRRLDMLVNSPDYRVLFRRDA